MHQKPEDEPSAVSESGPALSPRIENLKTYMLKGAGRQWTNAYTSWTTGTSWDVVFNEIASYTVSGSLDFLSIIRSSFRQAARPVELPETFWNGSVAERRAWFVREVMLRHLPLEILPGDLLAGGRFNIRCSMCLNEAEQKAYNRLVSAKNGARAAARWFRNNGYGVSGAVPGHIAPDYEGVLSGGWKKIHERVESRYETLDDKEKSGRKGEQLRAMKLSSTLARDLAGAYSGLCRRLSADDEKPGRSAELLRMAENLDRVPWEPADTFWQAVQSLWINHMLVMSDENDPGRGVSLGRMDQYLFPYWQRSIDAGMEREYGKEILRCFFIHAGTACDAMHHANTGGAANGVGQVITLSGTGPDGKDATNDLTVAILEVALEMHPLLEPDITVRLHDGSPDDFLTFLAGIVSSNIGAVPFTMSFDGRCAAAMRNGARRAGLEHIVSGENAHEYVVSGFHETTMAGFDRSGTADNCINLVKALDLALSGGKGLREPTDPLTGEAEKMTQNGPFTGDAEHFGDFGRLWAAFSRQVQHVIDKCVDLHERCESIRAKFAPAPYLSCLVKDCVEQGTDVTRGGARLNLSTINAAGFATTVDSLLAIRFLVFEEQRCTMGDLIRALRNNWETQPGFHAAAKSKAPKFGRADAAADEMARQVMDLWMEGVWKHRTLSTGRQFRPGMAVRSYWGGAGCILSATADGRKHGGLLSEGICPSPGMDVRGPLAAGYSIDTAIGGNNTELAGGSTHSLILHPSVVSGVGGRTAFLRFLRQYIASGCASLHLNIVDPVMLFDALADPKGYEDLLIRIFGQKCRFVRMGKRLQARVISARVHEDFGTDGAENPGEAETVSW